MENRKQHVALYLIRELTALLCNRAWRDVEKLRREILQLGLGEIVIYTVADMKTVRRLILHDRWGVDVRVARVAGTEYEKIKKVAGGPPRIELYTDGKSPRNGLRKRGGDSLRARFRRARKAGGYRLKGDGSGWKSKPRNAGGDKWERNGFSWKATDDKINNKPEPRKETGIRINEPCHATPYRRKNNVATLNPWEKGKGKVVEESSSGSSSDSD